MKKTGTIGALLMGLALFASSQDFKGRVLFAPSLSMSVQSDFTKTDGNKSDERNYQTYSIFLPVGYFVTPRTAIGLVPGYSIVKNKYNYDTFEGEQELVREFNMFYTGVFVRNYLPLSEKFNFLVSSEFNFGVGNDKEERNGSEEENLRMKNIVLSVAPGLNYSVTDQFFIELGIGSVSYFHNWTKEKDAEDSDPVDHTSSFSVNYNSLSLGVLFLF